MQITIPNFSSLQQAANGLLMPSETEAPFEVFFWPNERMESLPSERIGELIGATKEAKIESVSINSFFRDVTTKEEWHNEEEAATVQHFKALVRAIQKALDGPRVFRVGETTIDCFIAGDVEGGENAQSGVGGLKTQIVET